jgi:hypothetical protein
MVTFLSNHLTVNYDRNCFQEGLTRFITRSIFYMMMIKLTIFGHHKVATYLKVGAAPSARNIHFNINRLNIWIDL